MLVEDDAKLARFLGRVLQEEAYAVETCASGTAALAALAAHPPDVVILDWMLPDGDGTDICREARRRANEVPILMLTARGELADKVTGLESGADDYLAKPFEVDELLARIKALIRRSQPPQLAIGPLHIDEQRRKVSNGNQTVELTSREFNLLAYLARTGGEIVSRGALLAAIWGTNVDPGTNLVEVHMSRLRTKLGSAAWIIETVRGEGYRLKREGSG